MAVSLAAVLSGALVGATASAVEGDGKGSLQVRIVDWTGAPVDGQIFLMQQNAGPSAGGFTWTSRSSAGVYDFVDLPVHTYGAFTLSPWGGMTCAGISPCDYFSLSAEGPSPVTGAVTVVDSETPAGLTIRLAPPATIGGTFVVGRPLQADLSPQMLTMVNAFAPDPTKPRVGIEWLRDGTAIPDARGYTYTPTVADVGRTVSVRLSYDRGEFWDSRSSDWSPRTMAGGAITKVSTHTSVDVMRKRVVQGRPPGARISVSAGDLPGVGTVRIKVGKRTVTRTLRNGSTRVPVPTKLRPGRYRIVATYLGTPSHATSKDVGRFRVVRQR